MNFTARLEFELDYNNIAVQHVRHYTRGTTLQAFSHNIVVQNFLGNWTFLSNGCVQNMHINTTCMILLHTVIQIQAET